MKHSFLNLVTLPAAGLALCLSVFAEAAALYRYINSAGVVVIDDRVPAEYVAQGYEVLSSKGTVIRVVAPTLTEGEMQAMNQTQQSKLATEAEKERIRKWDESLLLRYSSLEDIEAAKARSVHELEVRVSILKNNRRSLRRQVENYQAQAANMERSGQQVDAGRLQVISDLQNEIQSTERSILERQEEIDKVADSYQQDMDRFAQLLELVELRRSLSSGAR